MLYLVRHYTRYQFDVPITENMMEVRLQPRADGHQRVLSFELSVDPGARVFSYRDALGNHVSHFDIPEPHDDLIILSESLVETLEGRPIPDSLGPDARAALDEMIESGDYWEMLLPSTFAHTTPKLLELMSELDIPKDIDDPLVVALHVARGVHSKFRYVPSATKVDSPIDDALTKREGVCQDFAHILIAALRELRIPARYVGGYLFHREFGDTLIVDDAMHAWVEVLLPEIGWLGLDPTADSVCGRRHIRTALGRDYADVPPTKGVYRGGGESKLSVSVKVFPWGIAKSAPTSQPPSRGSEGGAAAAFATRRAVAGADQ